MAQLQQLLTLAMALSTITALAFSTIPLTTANAIQTGDPVALLIRSDEIQPVPPASPNERMTFTGKPSSTKDIAGCGVGTFPLQQAVLVEPDGDSGVLDVIVTSETEPLPQGTEVQDLIKVSSCTIESDVLTYDRYTGIVTRTH